MGIFSAERKRGWYKWQETGTRDILSANIFVVLFYILNAISMNGVDYNNRVPRGRIAGSRLFFSRAHKS
jgi:hypothetical protein